MDRNGERYVCPIHGSDLAKGQECGDCVALTTGPLPESAESRALEIEQWGGSILTVRFDRLHKRMEGLCGRPVWTHEFAHPEELAAEVRAGIAVDPAITALEKIGRYARHAKVIVVKTPDHKLGEGDET